MPNPSTTRRVLAARILVSPASGNNPPLLKEQTGVVGECLLRQKRKTCILALADYAKFHLRV